MCQSQISEYKFEINKLNQEFSEVKNKYLFSKKKRLVIKELEHFDSNQGSSGDPIIPKRNDYDQFKLNGGGYILEKRVKD